MAEVCSIVNSRPIIPVSTDPQSPEILTPNTLLTLKSDHTSGFYTDLDIKDVYRVEWKRVQALAELFWKRWREEYLHTLQARRKWNEQCSYLKEGDVVLLKDKDVIRNDWPIGIVDSIFPSEDRENSQTSCSHKKGRQKCILHSPDM